MQRSDKEVKRHPLTLAQYILMLLQEIPKKETTKPS